MKNQKLGQLTQDKRKLAMKFEIASILNCCTTELSSNKDINLAINNILQIVNEYFYERTLTVHSLPEVFPDIFLTVQSRL